MKSAGVKQVILKLEDDSERVPCCRRPPQTNSGVTRKSLLLLNLGVKG